MVRKTSEMVEAGILAAVAVLFAVLGMYLPILGAVFTFLWAVPLAICGMRNGLRWSVMSLVVAGAVTGSLLGPLQSLSLMAMFGLLGLVLGECMYRGFKPSKTIVFSSAAVFVSLLLTLALGMAVMGTDPVEIMFAGIEQALQEGAEYSREAGLSEEEVAAAIKSNEELVAMLRLILPGSFIVCSPLLALMNYVAARKILTRLGAVFEPFPPFKLWRVPKHLLWLYIVSLLMLVFYADAPKDVYNLALNLQMITSVAFYVQGLALVFWWVEKSGRPAWFGPLAIILSFAVQVFSTFIVLLGAFETVLDYRGLKERSL